MVTPKWTLSIYSSEKNNSNNSMSYNNYLSRSKRLRNVLWEMIRMSE